VLYRSRMELEREPGRKVGWGQLSQLDSLSGVHSQCPTKEEKGNQRDSFVQIHKKRGVGGGGGGQRPGITPPEVHEGTLEPGTGEGERGKNFYRKKYGGNAKCSGSPHKILLNVGGWKYTKDLSWGGWKRKKGDYGGGGFAEYEKN